MSEKHDCDRFNEAMLQASCARLPQFEGAREDANLQANLRGYKRTLPCAQPMSPSTGSLKLLKCFPQVLLAEEFVSGLYP